MTKPILTEQIIKYIQTEIINKVKNKEEYDKLKEKILNEIDYYAKNTNKKLYIVNDIEKLDEEEKKISNEDYIMVFISEYGETFYVNIGIYNCYISENGAHIYFILSNTTDVNNFLGKQNNNYVCDICKKDDDKVLRCCFKCSIRFCNKCCNNLKADIKCPGCN